MLEALRTELDTLGVAPKASLVWKIDCSEGDVSDADLDSFAAYGAGIAPEKVRLRRAQHKLNCLSSRVNWSQVRVSVRLANKVAVILNDL